MKIGILSDTHLREPDAEFQKMIGTHFGDVDQIFHVGDFTDWSVAEYLSQRKDLVAVSGNMDPQRIREAFPAQQIVELCGFRVGLIHGHGPPFGIESRIRGEFDEVDVIVYGHTHIPANHRVKHLLFFNPGSACRPFVGGGTIGFLHVGEEIKGEIIKL